MYRLGGSRRLAGRTLLTTSLLGVLLVGVAAVVFVPDASALTREELAARRAERQAEREARAAERAAERAAREAEREAEDEETETPNCGCSAKLGFAKPDLQWRGSDLTFIPRVDVMIRTDGEATDPNWSAEIVYDGSTSYTSDDVTPPSPTSFAGSKTLGEGPCGRNRYTFKGLALEPVSLAGLTRALIGPGEELAGVLTMNAQIEGCGFDEEARSFSFTVEDFGNLRLRGWRSVR